MSARRRARGRPPSPAAEVLKFAAGGVIAVLVLGLATASHLRNTTNAEAIRDARDVVAAEARGVIEPNLTPEVLRGEPAALARFDEIVRRQALRAPLVRVKLWTPDYRIVYSDEPRLIGRVYKFNHDVAEALNSGGTKAGITHLAKAEEEFERGHRKLLEVYTLVHTTEGKTVIFEGYLAFDAVTEFGYRIWRTLVPVFIGALLFLEVVQLPLAFSLVRRLRDVQRDRESLLRRAIEASDTERRRIASDLHDMVVQNLAGVSFSLTAATEAAHANGETELAATIADAAQSTRASMRNLRTLLVEIDPPALHGQGLGAALSDYMSPLAARGIVTQLEVPADLDLSGDDERLLFRVGREALRNAEKHADPHVVTLTVETSPTMTTLVVRDDGAGFDDGALADAQRDGHVGLKLLSELAADAGATLSVQTEPGRGTTIRLAVPVE